MEFESVLHHLYVQHGQILLKLPCQASAQALH